MRILAVVIGLLSIPELPLLGGVGGVIAILFAIALYIYGSKEAGKKAARKAAELAAYAASPEGKAAAKKRHSVLATERVWAAPRDDLLKEPPPPNSGGGPAPMILMIGGGIIILIILVATQG